MLIQKLFSEIIAFVRPSPATRINAIGVTETVAANVPRLDHHPSSLQPIGLRLSTDMGEAATLSKTAPFYRADMGTWVIDGEFDNATVINGAVAGISGRGKLIVTYSNGVANVHSDADLMFSAPVQEHANIPLIIAGVARIERCKYIPSIPLLANLVGDQRVIFQNQVLELGGLPLTFKSSLSH